MKREGRKPSLRCAIYTRVSTENGLEQEFNSLDNQREASEAYSNAAAGATLVTRDTALQFAWIILALSLTNAARERRNDRRLV